MCSSFRTHGIVCIFALVIMYILPLVNAQVPSNGDSLLCKHHTVMFCKDPDGSKDCCRLSLGKFEFQPPQLQQQEDKNWDFLCDGFNVGCPTPTHPTPGVEPAPPSCYGGAIKYISIPNDFYVDICLGYFSSEYNPAHFRNEANCKVIRRLGTGVYTGVTSDMRTAQVGGAVLCKQTCYEDWRSLPYTDKLYSNPDFWRYQGVAFFKLSKGLALDLAVSRCERKFENLIKFRAGRSGPGDEGQAQHRDKDTHDPRGPEFPQTVKAPLVGRARNGGWTVNEQDAFSRAMCTDICQESDIIHNEALSYSACTCLQLSTPESADSFTILGDWCRGNSARLLCDILGQCGIWECELEDFMCPRREYNTKIIPYKGYGDCISASTRRFNAIESLFWTVSMFVISFILFMHS